jgi:ferritin-like protein
MNINDRDNEEKMRADIDSIVHPLLSDPMDMIGMYAATDRIMEVFKKYNKEVCDKTLESLSYNVERTKVFEEIADMLYKSEYDQRDAVKKIYEIVREKYPIGTYCPPSPSFREISDMLDSKQVPQHVFDRTVRSLAGRGKSTP